MVGNSISSSEMARGKNAALSDLLGEEPRQLLEAVI
jgi:hypothetical protein